MFFCLVLGLNIGKEGNMVQRAHIEDCCSLRSGTCSHVVLYLLLIFFRHGENTCAPDSSGYCWFTCHQLLLLC